MFGVALSLLLNQNSIMTKSCQDGIEEHTWVNFLGFYDEHSSLVENVCNLSTGYISTRFHLVFDDLFKTDIHTKDDVNFFTKFSMIRST